MSKIEVNAIEPQCGTTLTAGGGAGKTVVVDATTVTLGRCGGTVALASGASQTGFGRTGTVDWNTTPKTATFTAVSGDGFFANTTGSAFNMNLPAGSAGAIVSVADYAGTWQTNNLTVVPNGTEKINGVNANAILATEGQSVTLVYVDSTQGWINTMDSTSNVTGNIPFNIATGGTIATSGDYKIHVFTGPGTFCVSSVATNPANSVVDYVVIAGGGGAASSTSGGAGAGGMRLSKSTYTCGSPIANATGIPVSVQPYTITVGGGAAAGSSCTGSSSTFSSITSTGGGSSNGYNGSGRPGGSGAGGSAAPTPAAARPGGTGNTPPVSPPQGNDGGSSSSNTNAGGGGGGASQVGANTTGSVVSGGDGSFIPDTFLGPTAPSYGETGPSGRYFGGGGGGGFRNCALSPVVSGGLGGGGYSIQGPPTPPAIPGQINTGGGGGGGNGGSVGLFCGGAGGSGIVIIRYKFQ